MGIKPLFIMGTMSGAGKSTMVTAFARIFSNMGFKVSPFKAQNMSLNSAAAINGEIAYAQYVQAKAARNIPEARMNPILLKPEKDSLHTILMGKFYGKIDGYEYFKSKKEIFFNYVYESLNALREKNDIVIIEGAGSPAEINIEYDLPNRELAKRIDSVNILVSNIDVGGAFAQIVGTIMLANEIKFHGYILNKFRGDEKLLEPAIKYLEEKYRIEHIGTIPYMEDFLPMEDSLFDYRWKKGKVNFSIIKLPNIANSTDFHPFYFIKDAGISFAEKAEDIKDPDVIIIPGSKRTVDDLIYIRENGIEDRIKELHRDGTLVIGICGGYQMMGKKIIDNFESKIGEINGMGLLDSKTVFSNTKKVTMVEAEIIDERMKGIVKGYEIHFGNTESSNPFSIVYKENMIPIKRYDGSVGKNAIGTYIHDIFANQNFMKSIMKMFIDDVELNYNVDEIIEKIAETVEKNVKMERIIELMEHQ
ncbi:MAG: cobyric acid synthase [Thermoplasmata archaeon]|jgi:adenosylcobyric acid synthase